MFHIQCSNVGVMIILALSGSNLITSVAGATNGINDISSAYAAPTSWDTVDILNVQTFDTDEYTFDEMYNDPPALPKKKIGACIQSSDYDGSLTEACADINVRGASSRSADLKSIKIKLDKKAPQGKWRGRRHIILVKSPFDASRLRNAVVYALLSEVDGLIGIGLGYVRLILNGVDYGLYEVVEKTDDDYLENHGLSKQDTLLKADDFTWQPPKDGFIPNQDNSLEHEWLDCQNAPEAGNGEYTTDWFDEMSNIATLTHQAYWARQDGCELAQQVVADHIDVESLMTYMAINAITLESDGINHNYMLYKPVAGGKWSHFFWDRDGALDFWNQDDQVADFEGKSGFATYKQGMIYQMSITHNLLFRNFLRAEGNLGKLITKIKELAGVSGPLSGKRFTQKIEYYANIIRDDVSVADAQFWSTPTSEKFEAEVARLLKVYSNPLKTYWHYEQSLDSVRDDVICPRWDQATFD